MSSILNIGKSALAAAQAGLATTGHNIANASTPGYSRQVVIQGSAGAQFSGVGYLGKGTEVVDVRRVYNELLAAQVQTTQSSKNQVDTYYAQISRINNQFGDPQSGLAPVLQEFFASVHNLANSPKSAEARQLVLSSAEAMATRLRSLSGQLDELTDSVNRQIQDSVGPINVYARQIAYLNDAIEKAIGTNNGKVPNDLLDQRDYAIAELSKEIKVNVVKQGNSYNVMVGNGQPLVVGARSFDLVAMPAKEDVSRMSIGFINAQGERVHLPESTLTGGKLGGLLEFRAQSLDIAKNSLGRVAIGLARAFNEVHANGMDQNGAMGGTFFNVGDPVTRAHVGNTTNAELTARIVDENRLTTSDYRIDALEGGEFRITRLSDGQSEDFNSFPLTYDGVEIAFDASLDAPAPGDSFIVRPTVNAANDFTVAIRDVTKLAAALPIRTEAPAANTGTGTISAGNVQDVSNPALLTRVTIVFDDPSTYRILEGDPPADTGITGAYTPGMTLEHNGWTVELDGVPAAGDSFVIEKNENGVGDSRNAVALGALQTANTLGNGTLSFGTAYAQLVSLVGNKTHELEVTSKAEARYLEQAISAHEAESGVNLDEEAANLLRYQQAYQAAARMMQTAQQMFDILLQLGH